MLGVAHDRPHHAGQVLRAEGEATVVGVVELLREDALHLQLPEHLRAGIGAQRRDRDVVHAEERHLPEEAEGAQDRSVGVGREAEDEVRLHVAPDLHRGPHRAEHPILLDLLLDDAERLLVTALRGVSEVRAAGAHEEREHFRVERLGTCTAWDLPRDVQLLVEEPVRELDHPLLLDDRREVLEVEVRGAVGRDVVLDLRYDVGRRARHVARRPHRRARAERALVGAAARRVHRHAATAVDARTVVAAEVVLERDQVPRRPGEAVDVPHANLRA